jgi:hypothetical protein
MKFLYLLWNVRKSLIAFSELSPAGGSLIYGFFSPPRKIINIFPESEA